MNISGTNIRRIREEKEMHQVDLAAALSVEHEIELVQSDISEIERGIRGVKDFELVAIAKVLGVKVSLLLGEK